MYVQVIRNLESRSSSCSPCGLQHPYRAWTALPLSIWVAPGLSLAVHFQAIVAFVMQMCHLKSAYMHNCYINYSR